MLSRYDQLVRMGFKPPRPYVDRMRKEVWGLIDDSVPPEGDADGEFLSFVEWVNKASSWIGGTGAKCYDTKWRRCRNGGEMHLAHDEGAFPVRWYMPDRFPAPPIFGVVHAKDGATVTMDGEDLVVLIKDGAEWIVRMEGDPNGERRFPSRPKHATGCASSGGRGMCSGTASAPAPRRWQDPFAQGKDDGHVGNGLKGTIYLSAPCDFRAYH